MLRTPVNTTILQWNCRSYRPRKADLATVTSLNDIPILCLSEVKQEKRPTLSNYVAYSIDNIHRQKTQVTTLVHRSLPQQCVKTTTSPSFEAVVVEVILGNRKINVINIYIWVSTPLDSQKIKELLEAT